MPKLEQLEDILGTLEGFTVKENWDRFFTIRGSDNEFEWYAEWADLRGPLLAHLSKLQSQTLPLQILVPGCGVSNLSDHLYDAGFKAITNIDFSEIAVSDMLQRNACQRPGMKWQVMDMTTMQVIKLITYSQLDEIFVLLVRLIKTMCRSLVI